MRVTVFGGASPKPGEPAYQQALALGQLLAEAGHTVLISPTPWVMPPMPANTPNILAINNIE